MPYDAFISYSHSTDERLAPAVRDGLQKLAKPWNKRRALNIFLDKSSLEISAGLKGALHAKLEGTEWLILLLSEDSARSQWVSEEIANWTATKPANRIALVQTDGELYWGDGDWDWERSTAAPRALSGVYAEEPLWLDLRKYRDEPDLDIRSNSSFRDDLATLAAPLHGKSKEELVGEDLVQFRRSLRLRRAAITGLAVLTVLSITATVAALIARKEAIKEAKIATTRQLAAQALVESTDQPDLGLLLAVAAHDLDQELLAGGDIENSLDGPRSALLQILEKTPELVSYLTGFSSRPTALAAAHESSMLAVGETMGVVSLWDTSTFERGGALESLEGAVTAMVFSEGATSLAVGTEGGDVVIWDIGSGRTVEIEGEGSPVIGIAFDAALRRVAVAYRTKDDEIITIRETGSGSRIGDDLENFIGVAAMRFEGRNRLAVIDIRGVKSCEIGGGCTEGSGGVNLAKPGASAYLIEAGLGAVSHFFNGGINTGRLENDLDQNFQLGAGIISGMAFSPDGSVLTVVQEATMSFWHPLTGKQAGTSLLGIAAGQDTEIVFLSQDGSRLATLADGKVQVWDRGRKRRLGDQLPILKVDLPDAIGSVVGADFSPDGRRVAWIIDPAGDTRCPDEYTRKNMWTPDREAYYLHLQEGLDGLCDSEEGQTVAVWSRDTGKIVTLAAGLEQDVRFLDGTRICTDRGEVWDVENRLRIKDAKPDCFDSDKTWKAAGEGGFTRCEAGVLVRAELGALASLIAGIDLDAAALNTDTRCLAVLDHPNPWQVTVWMIDESGGESHSVIDLGAEVDTLNAFGKEGSKPTLTLSPDGGTLAVDYPSGGISFWNTDQGARLLKIPRDAIRTFDFSPDGKLVALDRVTGDIELRETTTLSIVGVLRGDGDTNARILKFRPDGKELMEAVVGGGITLWDVNVDSWRSKACALAGRPLDKDERRRFNPGNVAVDPCSSVKIGD
jgi:WD40 repeat protein